MKLYRGDSLPKETRGVNKLRRGKTFAELFPANGLIAKFADGGHSSLIEGKNLIDLVIEHIGYELNQPEQLLSDHSPMLSFSEKIETAFRFCTKRSKKIKYVECPSKEASHFIWKLDVDLPIESEPGIYDLRFKANSIHVRKDVELQLEQALVEEAKSGNLHAIASAYLNYMANQYVDADKQEHQAKLIDAVTFIQANNNSQKNNKLIFNALCRAKRDNEWLLYPCDPMDDGIGHSARFPLNENLHPIYLKAW
ncbi:MAG: hypothetical protein PHO08_08110 [Methylococcales bacterium]|nr:hypothetical protein [Methylococcales bacterium]MDD5632825.1 hypothetical protein [Methylococcales bacterium]